jgi:hypothetical protein
VETRFQVDAKGRESSRERHRCPQWMRRSVSLPPGLGHAAACHCRLTRVRDLVDSIESLPQSAD